MRPNDQVEAARYEGVPLSGLRNLPADFFPDEEYFLEDDTNRRPDHGSPDGATSPATLAEEQVIVTPLTAERRLGNESLPIYAWRDEIVAAVKDNPVSFIITETGAGKSTQVPQFLLEAGWDTVYLTQPRRAAARNVFERIRSEIGEVRGEYEAGNLVAYQTAGDCEGPQTAAIQVVTDGLQLVRELQDGSQGDHDVLIIDEVHEWNANMEVLVAWVKKAIAEKPNMRVVVMSATMDAEQLADYFAPAPRRTPPITEVPGRNFRVEQYDRPESTVVEEVVKAAKALRESLTDGDESNGILVFEPGKREIYDAIDGILNQLPPELAADTHVFPLHAKLSVAEQQAAFKQYPGIKIVVATNVAQTSLTIPDIAYVIDSGYERQVELDQEGVQGLVLHPISRADCQQRAGRAGRVADGIYIRTRLDGRTPHISYEARDEYPTAEILRTDIIRNTLRTADVHVDMAELDLFHPVPLDNIEQAQRTLHTLGALDEQRRITPLGHRMNQIPARVTSARMMVEASRYSEPTRAYMAAIVAIKEAGGLPYFAPNVGKAWKELTEETTSDLLAQLDMFITIQDMNELQMLEYNLDLKNIERAREQYHKIAKRAGAAQERLLPPTQDERDDLKRCIHAGMVTSIYRHLGSGIYRHVGGSSDTLRQISNRSLVIGRPSFVVGDPYRVEFMQAGERATRHIIEGVTAASPVDIGQVAAYLTNWKPAGLTLRNGKFVEVRRQHLSDIDLGLTQEAVAEPSPRLRAAVIEHVLANPGPQLSRLRGLKRQLEALAHLAKDPVKQLTHAEILELVAVAAPADITDPALVDHNLRLLAQDYDISLDNYVSAERRERIIADAPATISAGGTTFDVTYRRSRAYIKHFRADDIAGLNDEIYLPDGRPVLFAYRNKRCTLVELQEKLRVSRPLAPQQT